MDTKPKPDAKQGHKWVPEIIEQTRADDPSLEIVAETMRRESDRGCVVLGAEIMSAELEALLRSFSIHDARSVKKVLDELFRGYAPLATLSGRIDICFVFGLISARDRNDLHLLRQLRNDFAHEPGTITFETPRCHDRLSLLLGLPNLTNLDQPTEKDRAYFEHLRKTDPSDFRRHALTYKVITLSGYMAATRSWIKANPGSVPPIHAIKPSNT